MRIGMNFRAAALSFFLLGQLFFITLAGAADPRDDAAFMGARMSASSETGLLRFVGTYPGYAVQLIGVPGAGTSEDYGFAFASQYGEAFGIDDASTQLLLIKSTSRPGGGASVRYLQVHQDIPVLAGELVVNLDRDNALLSMNGEIAPGLTLPVTPTLTPDEARATALLAVAKWYGYHSSELEASPADLYIYDARMLKPSQLEPSLVWRVEVTTTHLAPLRELVLVDAHSGGINLHFNQVHEAKDRETHDALDSDTTPGTLVCAEADPFPACAAGDTDVINAHVFAGDSYDFYFDNHGRDGIDGGGSTITSTVHWDDGGSCPNAFWDGTQMVYCDDMADADDVVGHELTHGVTDLESNLYYYYQSGAINESLSDVWGEFIDLENGTGDDTSPVRWLLGEDLPGAVGVLRDMKNPGVAPFYDPDRMTTEDYWIAPSDNGGVHHNSGVNNKAAYLITDGDFFNGISVTGLGIPKTAAIYYEAQTNLLTSGSGYADLYDILYQACLNLVGGDGIIEDDCDEVRNATDAVEMNLDPRGDEDFSTEADICPDYYQQGTVVFADDLEAGFDVNWSTSTLNGDANAWDVLTGYATSGTNSMYAPDSNKLSDEVAWNDTPIVVPSGAFLHFRHSYAFESGFDDYDGGIVEYSTDGSTWLDLDALFDDGRDYNGTISPDYDNPLAGYDAFVNESHGYVSSRYDLSTLSGGDFQVRFRIASDSDFAGPLGWTVDDVMVYQCDALFDDTCSGVDVLIQGREFTGETLCLASNTLAANTAVTVKSTATVSFISLSSTMGPGFSVEKGGVWSVDANP